MITEGAVRRVHIIQGEYKVLSDPDAVLSTILGSCVAACLRDPVAGVGGMNHFLLPGNAGSPMTGGDATRYGVHLMELLINGLLKQEPAAIGWKPRYLGVRRRLRPSRMSANRMPHLPCSSCVTKAFVLSAPARGRPRAQG